eukprot:1251203-Pyramimonas_sp.AAC.1
MALAIKQRAFVLNASDRHTDGKAWIVANMWLSPETPRKFILAIALARSTLVVKTLSNYTMER